MTSAALNLTATTSVTPGNIYYLGPLGDAQVSSGNPTTNSGTATSMFVQSSTTTASSFGDERAWTMFDLSSLPSGAVITSAQLQLYCFSAASTELDIAVAGGSSDSWTETGITWNTQPSFGSTLDTVAMVPSTTDTYSWDVTSFVQSKFADNKLVSLVAKPVVEGSATTIGYRFDCKEFGSNAPVLAVTTATSGPAITVTQVQFYYRFSSDNATWGAWTSAGAAATAPYSTAFAFPQGYGYYEFYSIATDSIGGIESAPVAAQTATHYTAAPVYSTAAVVTLGNLSQTYNGSARVATATTVPPGLTINLTYDGSADAPVNAGLYNVVATTNQASYTGSATGTLAVAKINQTITFGAIAPKTMADAPFALSGSASSGLGVTYTSSNPAVATVSGSTVTIVGPGTTTITADQIGNVNYYSANPVDQTLTVTSAPVPGDSSDVPAMPLWAIAALATTLFVVAGRLLKPHSQHNAK
jgi:hypothetical protein